MPRKGMRCLCFSSKTPSSIYRDSPTSSTTPPSITFTDSSTIEQTIETAAKIITKWNPDTSTFAKFTSMFYESRGEAIDFLECVIDLQKSMDVIISEDSASPNLGRAHNLMQIAMKRLQKEFYQILSVNRAQLDPESVSTRSSRTSAGSSVSEFDDVALPDDDDVEIRVVGDSIAQVEEASTVAMSDLRSIADCMISSGYAQECLTIYKTMRKSIVDEGIYRLGLEKLTASQIKKMEWDVFEVKIEIWLEAVKIAIKTLFKGERILCDHVFESSDAIKESCFNHTSKEAATLMFGFPELVVTTLTKTKKTSHTDKIFRVLDMYTIIAENWMEIESIFSFNSTSTIRSLALNSLIQLGESTRLLLNEFESRIEKDSSKSMIPGGGVHPLTISSMNYITLLSDYSNILTDVIDVWSPPEISPLSNTSYFDAFHSVDPFESTISARIAYIILILLCKIDDKAKQYNYKDISSSYLFLANNLQHVISTIRTSNIQYIVGREWIEKHEAIVRQFASKYEGLAWGLVYSSLPEEPTADITPEEAKNRFKMFSVTFGEACRKQRSRVVTDRKLREEIKTSIARKLVPVYRKFYEIHRMTAFGGQDASRRKLFIKFRPNDVSGTLSDLFLPMNVPQKPASSSTSSSLLSDRRSRTQI